MRSSCSSSMEHGASRLPRGEGRHRVKPGFVSLGHFAVTICGTRAYERAVNALTRRDDAR
jgi:hypothetical protein